MKGACVAAVLLLLVLLRGPGVHSSDPGSSCANPIPIDADDTMVQGSISPAETVYYLYTLGPTAKALLFEIFPSVNDDYIQMEMSQVDLNGCPGSFLSCEAQGTCPDLVQETERKFLQAGLSDVVQTERIAVGVNQPTLSFGGRWVLAVRGKSKAGFTAPRNFQLRVKVGINACRVPEKTDMNENMCRKFINYPVLDVSLLQRDVQSSHVSLSVNDPRTWMATCRANVDNLYCFQTFLKCDEVTGVGIELCRSSCESMNKACRKSENKTIPNLNKLDDILCKTQDRVQNSSFFTSRFAHGNTDCLKVEGVDSYTDLDYKDKHAISTMAFELLVAMGAVIAITIVSYLLYSFVHKERKYGDLQKLTEERMDDMGDEGQSYIDETNGFEIAEI